MKKLIVLFLFFNSLAFTLEVYQGQFFTVEWDHVEPDMNFQIFVTPYPISQEIRDYFENLPVDIPDMMNIAELEVFLNMSWFGSGQYTFGVRVTENNVASTILWSDLEGTLLPWIIEYPNPPGEPTHLRIP